MFPYLRESLKDLVLRVTPEQIAQVENVILRETLANAEFSRHLESKVAEVLKGGGYKQS